MAIQVTYRRTSRLSMRIVKNGDVHVSAPIGVCQTAMNCDGGTTAILWYRGEPIIRCSNTRTPEGRYLPNAWVYVGK